MAGRGDGHRGVNLGNRPSQNESSHGRASWSQGKNRRAAAATAVRGKSPIKVGSRGCLHCEAYADTHPEDVQEGGPDTT